MDSRYSLPFTAYPPLHPASLSRLPQPLPHPNPSSLPASIRFKSTYRTSLQEEADMLEWEEETWVQSMHDTRIYGYSWMIPLGKQNTQEEDVESSFSSSPRATTPISPGPAVDPPTADAEQVEPINAAEVPVVPVAAVEEGAGERDLDAEIEDADASPGGESDEAEDEDEEDEEEEEEGGDDDDDEEEEEVEDEADEAEDDDDEEEDAGHTPASSPANSATNSNELELDIGIVSNPLLEEGEDEDMVED